MGGRKQHMRNRNRERDGEEDTRDEGFIKRSGSKNTKNHPKKRRFKHGLFSGVEVNLKTLLISGTLTFSVIFFFIYYYMEDANSNTQLRAITPLPVPKIMDLPQLQGKHRESLYWGTYRPQVYLGIRARTPKSLLAGLMWIGVKDGQYLLRHTCQMSDELSIYGWLRHDGRNYGHQDDMEVHYAGFNTPHMHNLTELVRETLGMQTRMIGRLQLPDTTEVSPNVAVFQISSKIPFEMDIVFVSGTDAENAQVQERVENLSGYPLRAVINPLDENLDWLLPQIFIEPHERRIFLPSWRGLFQGLKHGFIGLIPLKQKYQPTANLLSDLKLLNQGSPILKKQLDLIRNQSLLWTSYGLRSLATTSSLYMKRNTEHDPPYWRGPVWINMNYLILSALHHYAQGTNLMKTKLWEILAEDGPYKTRAAEAYTELRKNLIGNIVFFYFRSGYFWEQYDNTAAGKGKGAHPFTGWTSLIVLIMAEMY